MVQLSFNPMQHEPDAGAGPLPEGDYILAATSSAIKATNNNDGAFLEIIFEVQQGPYKGRKLYNNYNINNKEAKTVEIAYRQLSSLYRACGIFQDVGDTQYLHGRPFLAAVTVIEPTDDQKEKAKANGKTARAQNRMNNLRTSTGVLAAEAHMGAAGQAQQPPPSQPSQPMQPAQAPGGQPWGAPAGPAQQPQQPAPNPAAQQAPWGATQPHQPPAQPPAQTPAQQAPQQASWGAQPQQGPAQQPAQPQGQPAAAPWGAPIGQGQPQSAPWGAPQT